MPAGCSDRCGGSGGCEPVLGPAPNSMSGLTPHCWPWAPAQQRHSLPGPLPSAPRVLLGQRVSLAPISLQSLVLSGAGTPAAGGTHCGADSWRAPGSPMLTGEQASELRCHPRAVPLQGWHSPTAGGSRAALQIG